VLTDEARKRLKAIEEFSELGSGFNIAMRDLDIRGAGNILGGEQSGFISEIGFEMYQKILDEALMELKETDFKELYQEEHPKEFIRDCQIETDFEVLIPDHYISNITERLSLYKQLDSIDTEEALLRFRERLIDRFGSLPYQTESLIQTIRLRWKAKKIGFEKLVMRNGKLVCYFVGNEESPYFESSQFTAILNFMKENPTYFTMKEERNRLFLTFRNVISIEDALGKLGRIPITQ